MAKRRTSGIQRRSRASDEAMGRRLGAGTSRSLDWRVLLIGGILVLGRGPSSPWSCCSVVAAPTGGGDRTAPADAGGTHIAEGTQGTDYTSVPATSGQHWNTADSPGPWGVYTTAQPQERMVHNLEHGGIVIWYQPAQLDAPGWRALTQFVQQQITEAQFKVILYAVGRCRLRPPDRGHRLGLAPLPRYRRTSTRSGTFIDAHYGQAPEPFGGPAQPGT